jgi:hypothetical protein
MDPRNLKNALDIGVEQRIYGRDVPVEDAFPTITAGGS